LYYVMSDFFGELLCLSYIYFRDILDVYGNLF